MSLESCEELIGRRAIKILSALPLAYGESKLHLRQGQYREAMAGRTACEPKKVICSRLADV